MVKMSALSSRLKKRRNVVDTISLWVLIFFLVVSCGNGNSSLKTVTIEIEGKQFRVEVAKTDKERQRGLMFRKTLGDNEGMLFVFSRDQHLSFWMKNTSIPLSIAFISSDGKIMQIEDMEPFSERPVISERSVRYALELKKGTFDRIGAKVGSVVNLPKELSNQAKF